MKKTINRTSKDIYKKNKLIYIGLWSFFMIIGNIDNFLRGDNFDWYSLLNIISFIIFIIVLPLYSERKTYRKKIYLSEDFHIGLLIFFFGIFGLFFVDHIWGGVTFILTLGLVPLILSNFEREVYKWGVNKYGLKKKDRLLLLPCPECRTINAFTKDREEEFTRKNLTCEKCGFDLSNEYKI